MVGTGKHRSNTEMVESIAASGAEIVTVAIRRLNLDNPKEKNIGTGLVGAPACGDVMKLQIKVNNTGKIVDA